MLLTFAALILWFVTGFDIEEGAVPLIGIQWSTFATFFFWFYVLLVNFQIGGIVNANQLYRSVRFDLSNLKAAEVGEQKLSFYFALPLSLLIVMSATFAFEAVWVPLYDFFQFGSWTWPVYFAIVTADPLTSPAIRNTVLSVGAFFAFMAIRNVLQDFGFKLKLRLDFFEGWLLVAAALLWVIWIAFPGSPIKPSDLTPAAIQGPFASTFNASNCYIFPRQIFFPQNTYTFYPCDLFMRSYRSTQILGFFVPNVAIHSINVLTKFITFAAICYPAMALVKKIR